MGEVSTTGGAHGPEGPELDPPRGDEGLDDWFARRLQAQGIVASRTGFPTARILAVGFLVIALLVLGWVLSGIGSSGSTTAASTPSTTGHTTTGGPPATGPGKKRVAWRTIPLTVLNGYGGAGAATTAETQLRTAGWKVTGVANAGTTSVTATAVVFVPGQKALAVIVARRLHLPPPVKLADVAGLQPASIDGVAIVLGPNGLPSLSTTATGATT
jgi:hypothetical protein